MADIIKLEYEWNAQEALSARDAHQLLAFRKPFRLAANIIAFLAMFAGVYRIVVFGWSLFPIAIFCGGCYWMFLMRYDVAWTFRRRFKKRPDNNKIVKWHISENELHSIVDGIGESTLNWTSFSKAVHTPQGFLLYQNDQMYNWFPHRGFINATDISRLSELVKAKIGEYRNIAKTPTI